MGKSSKTGQEKEIWYLFCRVFLTTITKAKFLNGDETLDYVLQQF